MNERGGIPHLPHCSNTQLNAPPPYSMPSARRLAARDQGPWRLSTVTWQEREARLHAKEPNPEPATDIYKKVSDVFDDDHHHNLAYVPDGDQQRVRVAA